MPSALDPPRTAAAAQQGSNSLYFDMGSLLGGSLGSSLASGLTASNGAIGNGWGNITLSGIQQQMNQLSAITAGTPSNSVYHVSVDLAAQASWSGVQIYTVPSMPPGEIRLTYPQTQYVYSQRADGWYGFTQQAVYGSIYPSYGEWRQETTEQRIAREEREVKERAARSAAEKRAEQLMFSILKPEQVRQYRDHGYFETEIDDRVYSIHKRGHSQNVELVVKGKVIAKYCAHPENAYQTPVQDTMISQLLALHHNEALFLKTANKTIIHQ